MEATTIEYQPHSTIHSHSTSDLLSQQSTIIPSSSFNTDDESLLKTPPSNLITSTLSAIAATIKGNTNDNDDDSTITSKIIKTITTTITTKSTNNDDNIVETITSETSTTVEPSLISTVSTLTSTLASTTKPNKLSVNDLSSSLQLFGWADYFVFVLMLIICAVIGIYFGFVEKKKFKGGGSNDGSKRGIEQQRRGSEALDYLVGGRKMQVFPVSMSLVASYVSGISLLGTSTEIYVYGTQYAFLLITIVFSGIICWNIFLPVFCNLQLTSTYEYFEMRFDKRIRLLGSTLFSIGTVLWLPIVIYVPALAFNQVTGINIHIITPVVCVVCIFYTCVGGLKAVVWTDVVQSFIMFGSMIVVIIKGTINVGGLGEVIGINYKSGRIEGPYITLDHTVRFSIWSVFIGSIFHWLQNICTNQVMMQRFLALPNLKKARHALILFMIGVTALLGICIYNGLLIYATYHQCDPLKTKLAKAHDQLMPLLVMDILGAFPGMPGLFVAGVFSAALSSLSTGLNSLTAVFLEDFIKPNINKPLTEHQTAIFMKSVVVVFGIICVGLVFVVEKLGMVLQLSATMSALANGPLLGVFFIGVLMPWINGSSALFGCTFSFIFMGYIAVRTQVDLASGTLTFPTKPTSIEGCHYSHNYTSPIHSNDEFINNVEKPFYHMSFMYYAFLGSLITIIGSIVSSFYFGFANIENVDPVLFAPFIRKYIKNKKYFSIRPDVKEMETIIRAYDNGENENESENEKRNFK